MRLRSVTPRNVKWSRTRLLYVLNLAQSNANTALRLRLGWSLTSQNCAVWCLLCIINAIGVDVWLVFHRKANQFQSIMSVLWIHRPFGALYVVFKYFMGRFGRNKTIISSHPAVLNPSHIRRLCCLRYNNNTHHMDGSSHSFDKNTLNLDTKSLRYPWICIRLPADRRAVTRVLISANKGRRDRRWNEFSARWQKRRQRGFVSCVCR